jgi:hypothetical protein
VRAGTGLVFIDRPPALIDTDAVLLDNVGGARTTVRHLLELGHRRIAMIGGRSGSSLLPRLHGYRDALAAAGRPAIRRWWLGARRRRRGRRGARRLRIADPPTNLHGQQPDHRRRDRPASAGGPTGSARRLRRLRARESLATPTTVVTYDAGSAASGWCSC